MVIENEQPSSGAEIFVRTLVTGAYNNVKSTVSTILEKGPAGGRPDPKLKALSKWYQNADEDDIYQIKILVSFVARMSVFQCCAILDGAVGGYPIKDTVSDFALYLQTYEDAEASGSDRPQTRVRLDGHNNSLDLHDIFNSIVDGDQ